VATIIHGLCKFGRRASSWVVHRPLVALTVRSVWRGVAQIYTYIAHCVADPIRRLSRLRSPDPVERSKPPPLARVSA